MLRPLRGEEWVCAENCGAAACMGRVLLWTAGVWQGENGMDMKTLQYFCKAAEMLNFTQAAKSCYISQTAMSLSISKLEKELGFLLFDRSNRTVKLTPAGRSFYEWARSTLHSYENMVLAGRDIAVGHVGKLSIGYASCFDALWFNPMMKEFRREYSQAEIEARILLPWMLQEALFNKNVDAIVLPTAAMLPHKDVVLQEVAVFPMILICRKDHPLVQMGEVPLSRLPQYTAEVLSYERMSYAKSAFTQACFDAGIRFKSMLQKDYIEEIFVNLMNNEDVGFLPEFLKDYLNDFLVARPLEGQPMQMSFSFCYFRNNRNPILKALDRSLQQNYAKRS